MSSSPLSKGVVSSAMMRINWLPLSAVTVPSVEYRQPYAYSNPYRSVGPIHNDILHRHVLCLHIVDSTHSPSLIYQSIDLVAGGLRPTGSDLGTTCILY